MNRRSALKGIVAIAAGPLFVQESGQDAAAAEALQFIDVHHHFVASAFADFNARFIPGSSPLPWNLASDLADMDQSGTAMAVLSGFTPSVGGTAEDRRQLARGYNEFGARLVNDHPHRFALFATLPIPDIEGSLKEAAYSLDTLGAVGLTVYTDAGDKWLGDPIFADLYAELDRRRAIVFVHPHSPACCTNLVPHVPDSIIEFGAATTRTIASLIFSGTTQKYPNIQFIFSHGGGAVPFLIERLLGNTQAEIVPGIVTEGSPHISLAQPPGTALAELRKFYYDTAQITNPVSLEALRSVVGVSRIVYGTDAWFRTGAQTTQALIASRIFEGAELKDVARLNALRLMPSLRTRA